MTLQLIRSPLPENSSIAPRLRIIQVHGFLEEFEAVDLVDCARGGVDIVENDERLALCFQVGFCDDFDYRAVFGEDLFEGFLELVDFDSLFEVSDLRLVVSWCGR